MKTLYLHIGTPKTGTTAIQTFCCDNREVLEKQGYCYPQIPFPGLNRARNGLFLEGQIHDSEGKREIEKERCIFREGMDTVCRLFQKFDHVILSDEIIWKASYKRRKTLWEELAAESEAGNFQIKIIVYLRRQDEYVSSWWNQMIKFGRFSVSRMDWEEYAAKIPRDLQANYYETLEKISGFFGRENMIVRRYDKNHFLGGTIQEDFLHAIGLRLTEEYQIRQDFTNLKLSGNTQEIKRILNRSLDMNGKENTFLRNVLLLCAEESEKEYPANMFSREEAKQFMEQYEACNRKIAEEYLGEPDTPLFELSFRDVPKWQKDNPYILDDIIRFSGAADVDLFREIEKLKEEIRVLQYERKHPFRALWKWIRNAE